MQEFSVRESEGPWHGYGPTADFYTKFARDAWPLCSLNYPREYWVSEQNLTMPHQTQFRSFAGGGLDSQSLDWYGQNSTTQEKLSIQLNKSKRTIKRKNKHNKLPWSTAVYYDLGLETSWAYSANPYGYPCPFSHSPPPWPVNYTRG